MLLKKLWFLSVCHGVFIPSPHILLIMTVLCIDNNQVIPPPTPPPFPHTSLPSPPGFNVKFIITREPVDESQRPSMETFSPPGPEHFGTGRGPASDPDPEVVMGNGTLRLTATYCPHRRHVTGTVSGGRAGEGGSACDGRNAANLLFPTMWCVNLTSPDSPKLICSHRNRWSVI